MKRDRVSGVSRQGPRRSLCPRIYTLSPHLLSRHRPGSGQFAVDDPRPDRLERLSVRPLGVLPLAEEKASRGALGSVSFGSRDIGERKLPTIDKGDFRWQRVDPDDSVV